jgi:hypothetical protein
MIDMHDDIKGCGKEDIKGALAKADILLTSSMDARLKKGRRISISTSVESEMVRCIMVKYDLTFG